MHDDLGDLAQRLGRFMAERLTDGLPGHFGDDLLEAFPDEGLSDLKLALGELRSEGLVTLSPLINLQLPRIVTTVKLFVACDASITGQSLSGPHGVDRLEC